MSNQLKNLILQLGVGGTIAVVILIVVFKYGFPALKTRKNGVRCIQSPDAKAALERNLLSNAAIDRTELKVDALGKESAQQTTHLGMIATQATKQTDLLQKLVKK